ncbi:BRO family protein [Cupriavidus pauculus]|uniref:BRO family protein n=1 Tax=Cupriavidus pauculus TaxID=82633 RepID=UPI001D0C5A40|nr:BRO family protein [Cupriavidus pauculus]
MQGTQGNAVRLFNFHGSNVRIYILDDGQPWFVARDVASLLGYAKARNAIAEHCKAARLLSLPTAGGMQQMTVIPERDIYRLVMRSRLPAAERFEEWVVGEVLPTLNRTGRYQMAAHAGSPQIPQSFAEALRLAADLQEQIEVQAKQLALAEPAIHFTQEVADMTGLCKIEYVAKTLGHGRNRFFAQLKKDKILQENRIPYQRYLERGWFEVVERQPWEDSKGEKHPAFTTMVTGKGQIELARRYPHPDDQQPTKSAKRKALAK